MEARSIAFGLLEVRFFWVGKEGNCVAHLLAPQMFGSIMHQASLKIYAITSVVVLA